MADGSCHLLSVAVVVMHVFAAALEQAPRTELERFRQRALAKIRRNECLGFQQSAAKLQAIRSLYRAHHGMAVGHVPSWLPRLVVSMA
jgi:hypothetical protein